MVLQHPCVRSSSFFPTSFFQGIPQRFTNSTCLPSILCGGTKGAWASCRPWFTSCVTSGRRSLMNPIQHKGKKAAFFISGEQHTFLRIFLVTFHTQVFCLILASCGNSPCVFVALGLANLAVPSKSFWIHFPSSVIFDRHWRLKDISKWDLDTLPWSVAVGPGASPVAFRGYSLGMRGWRLTDVLNHSFVSHNLLS